MTMIRGVNIGGYFVLERYITPYQFMITDCHVRGDYCWYPQQISSPSKHLKDSTKYQECRLFNTTTPIPNDENNDILKNDVDDNETTTVKYCTPIKVPNAFGNLDYPLDEKTFALAFLQPLQDAEDNNSNNNNNMTTNVVQYNEQQGQIAEGWLNYHLEYFITKQDLITMKQNHITHLRVPIPHWILGDEYIYIEMIHTMKFGLLDNDGNTFYDSVNGHENYNYKYGQIYIPHRVVKMDLVRYFYILL
jgi:glucan 1,3-beta-glucosidase